MFGDGDCGQLGMGEDVTERLRPFPLSIDGGKKVGAGVCCVQAALADAFVAGHGPGPAGGCWISSRSSHASDHPSSEEAPLLSHARMGVAYAAGAANRLRRHAHRGAAGGWQDLLVGGER